MHLGFGKSVFEAEFDLYDHKQIKKKLKKIKKLNGTNKLTLSVSRRLDKK